MYAIDDQLIDRARVGDDYLQPLLAAFHRSPRRRPRCLCSASETGGVDMYVARIGGRYVLKRMPGTGPHHAPACSSYTPPAELTGLAALLGTAIREQPSTGLTRLTLSFPLTRNSSRRRSESTDLAPDSGSADVDGNRLTLRALLHFLWDEAGFVRWVPAMAGRRNWPAIRRHILLATQTKTTRSRELPELLWLPEPFTLAQKADIAARRTAAFAPLLGPGKHRELMLALGEVKDIAPARFGRHKLLIKHAPDCPFMIEPDTLTHLRRTFATELALRQGIPDSKLIALLTFGVTAAGVAIADRIALMSVSTDWIPFESVFEHTLISALVGHGRRFTKSLRYNQPVTSPLASLVLTDTDPPTACYLTTGATSGPPALTDANLPLKQWIWNTSVDPIPAIPTTVSHTRRTGPARTPSPRENAQEAPDQAPTQEAPPCPTPSPHPTDHSTNTPCTRISANTTS
ncbi:DUF1173 family protein [Nocardia sp. NBC_01388]|uniref:DUF1173 family protein n=1 Tax=Nocardia sp. NBC_01388 TaxID=2903596 RepID=UPI00324F59D7